MVAVKLFKNSQFLVFEGGGCLRELFRFPMIKAKSLPHSIPRLITSDSEIANDDNDISATSRLILI